MPCESLRTLKDGSFVTLAGLVLMRQRPGTAKGIMFITIEDETGIANLILWKDRIEQQRRAVIGSTMMVVRGQLQREGEVTHVIIRTVEDRSHRLRELGACGHQQGATLNAPARNFR